MKGMKTPHILISVLVFRIILQVQDLDAAFVNLCTKAIHFQSFFLTKGDTK